MRSFSNSDYSKMSFDIFNEINSLRIDPLYQNVLSFSS